MNTDVILASCLAVAVLAAPPSAAHGYEKGDLAVRHPWTRATPPGSNVAAGYLEIRNSGTTSERLLGAASPAADRVELHVTNREGDVVGMRERDGLKVPARQRLVMRPGGPHLMLIGLKRPFAMGDRVPITLRFERAGEVQIEIEVQAGDSRRAHH
jgi:hypothetical protein